ncbi:MAG TPA: hypothetical protein VLS45_03460 [Methylomicrobium sp.]|nr:hypothetical protein [Methylomicrobium sp.]
MIPQNVLFPAQLNNGVRGNCALRPEKINFLATLQPLASPEAKTKLQAAALVPNGEISGLAGV